MIYSETPGRIPLDGAARVPNGDSRRGSALNFFYEIARGWRDFSPHQR